MRFLLLKTFFMLLGLPLMLSILIAHRDVLLNDDTTEDL
jgi:hypothetical protein